MRRALALVASLVSYGLGALVVIGPQNLLTPDRAAGKGLDLPGTIWIHHWVAQETLAGRFPVRTDLLFYPDGKNFLADTGANYVDAWLGMPLQWLVGVPQYLGWLGLLILVLNALAARSVVAGLTGRASAAWAAGMVVLLNPFTAQELAEGRPTQALIPFGILAVGQLLRVREGWRHAVLFGALVAAQAVTYWFTPYFLAVALLPVALVLSRSAPRVVVPRLAATVVSLLALAVISDLTAVFMGMVVGTTALGIPYDLYVQNTIDQLKMSDFLTGLMKAGVFGLLLGLIACYNGLRVTGGAAGVGRATTETVVQTVIFVILSDLFFSTIFYAIGWN